MVSREEFVFTIGYDGSTAMVDSKAKARYGKLSTIELAQKSLFRAAFASALFGKNDAEFNEFARYFNAVSGTAYTTVDEFKRLFGVNMETVKRVLSL